MSQPGDSSDNNPWLSAFNIRTLTVGGEVGCVTLIIALAAVFGGLWLDGIFNTKPLLTVVLVIGSIPLSLFLTYWIAIRAVKRIQPSISKNHIERDGSNPSKGDVQT
jgi:hypothetical protein